MSTTKTKPMPRAVRGRPKGVELSQQPAGTFERTYQDKVRPKIKNPEYRRKVEGALSRFYLWRDGPTPLAEMSDRLIDQFGMAAADSGLSEASQKQYIWVLRRVLRQIDRTLCRPSLHGWKRRDYKPGVPGTLSHFFELTYMPLRLLDAADTTVHQHRMTLDALASFLGREPVIADLTDETLAGFMRQAIQKGMAPPSVNNRRCYFSAWWRFAKRRGLVSTMPDVPKIKEYYREPSSWSLEQMSQILYSTMREEGTVGNVPAAAWWLAFLEFTYAMALRCGTVFRVTHDHLNLATGLLEVPGSMMKNRRGKKFVLSADAIAAVRAIWNPSRGKIFAHKWSSKRGPYFAWQRIIKRAGIKWDRYCGFHMLRRTSATWVAVKGGMVAAMSLLGHSEDYVTRRYVDPSRIPGHNVAAYLPPIPRPEVIAAAMAKGGAA